MHFHTALLFLTAALAGGATADLLVRSVTATTTLIYLTPITTPTLIIYPTWSKNSTSMMTYPGTGMTSIHSKMNQTMTMSYNTTMSNSTSIRTQTLNATVTRTICDQQSRCSVTVSVGPTVVVTGTGTGTGAGTGTGTATRVIQPTMTPFTSGIGRVMASGGWIAAILCGAVLLL